MATATTPLEIAADGGRPAADHRWSSHTRLPVCHIARLKRNLSPARMKQNVSHALRLGLTLAILAFLVVFATKVNWHQIGAGIISASRRCCSRPRS